MYPKLDVILVAAGMGTRLGGGPKALLKVDGATLLGLCLDVLSGIEQIQHVVIACVPGMMPEFQKAVGVNNMKILIVEGGAERHDSVESAFLSLPKGAEVVAIHDAARPYASRSLFLKTAEAAAEYGAAIPILPATDTVKIMESGLIKVTPDRKSLGYAQTPQCFRRELFEAAMESWVRAGRPHVTDDASIVERIGLAVAAVDGERENLKITYPEDLTAGKKDMIKLNCPDGLRVGHGYDLHRTEAGKGLLLGGVHFDCGFGLTGHSDADVLAHAVCDALLGAACMGDIGTHFPDTDPRFKGADSMVLLGEVSDKIRLAGFKVVNLDCTIVAERPRIAPVSREIAARIAACVGVKPGVVSVKGKTNEKLGPEGRGEAISATVVALLSRE
jgi:2-C-methyl-D-erythritol 4-phosphate cytidylyltransferase/2-C-methyl-D-erythritol 2,4-cyclodiphosphate synthase